MAPTRLLVLGVDAASPELLERWAAEGRLPAIAALLARGRVAQTSGVELLYVGSTWPTVATGVGPGHHGVHNLAQLRPGTYAYEWVAQRPQRQPPFWQRASDAGLRVAVLDVPLAYPAVTLNGIQTVEWGAHDTVHGYGTYPPELAGEIAALVGAHPQSGNCDAPRTTAADYRRFVDSLVGGAALKGRLTRELLGRGGWDLFVQVFSEAHCAGHQCWHLHDADHPAHDRALAAALGDPLLEVYAAIDAELGRIVDAAGDAAVLLVVAHGMSHLHGSQLLLADLLVALGLAAPLPPPSRAHRAARGAWHLLPRGVRHRVAPLVDRPSGAPPSLAVDPQRSACLPVANGMAVGAIRLNLAGREPHGVVAPADADAVWARLQQGLLAAVDARSGRRLVRRVVRTRDVHDGPARELLPDVLVEWDDSVPLVSVQTASTGAATARARAGDVLVARVNDWARTGEHRAGGLVCLAGPGVEPGRGDAIDLVDVAPTILQLLGAPAPGLAGRSFAPMSAGRPPRLDDD